MQAVKIQRMSGIILIIISCAFFLLNLFGSGASFMDWFFMGGAFLCGIYFSFQAKHHAAKNEKENKNATISPGLFFVCGLSAIIITGVLGVKTGHFPILIILITHPSLTVLLIILTLVLKKNGYLSSRVSKMNKNVES